MASAWGKSWGAAFGVAFGLAAAPAPELLVPVSVGGGGTSMAVWQHDTEQQLRLQIQQEDEFIISAVAHMIASGALG